jgi:capsular exopolysaccharide synthesis family protein
LTVTDHNRDRAKKLVREYATQYIEYRKGLDTGVISRTIDKIKKRLKSYKSAADKRSPVYFGLVRQRDLLRTQLGLRTASAFLVSGAQGTTLVQPLTVRNVAIGLGVGLALGIALAFLLDALDTRVRSAEEIAEALELPILAAIPPAPRKLPSDKFLMIEDPKAHDAEAFRMLRANLAFADVEGDVRSIMVCSALADEGKTTTLGNLAVALARAGRSVVVVDFDLRRPTLGRAFGLQGKPGVTNAALGQISIDDALHPVAVGKAPGSGENGHGELDALLRVMPAGPLPPSPGEFAASGRVAKLLQDLRTKADVVLIDTPPLLSVGDGLAISANVDGVLVVSRARVIKRRALKGLRTRLDNIGARMLGLAVTGVKGGDAYYSYYGAYGSYATDASQPTLTDAEVEGGTERSPDEAERETKA